MNPLFWIASLTVAGPMLAGAGALLWPKSAAARRAPLAAALLSLAATVLLLGDPAARGKTVAVDWAASLGLALSWRLEIAPLAFALLVSGVGALVLHYGLVYFRGKASAGPALGLMSCFLAAMLGLVLAGDLLLLFVFWELTGIFSFFLIRLDGSRAAAAAARQALLVTVAGGLPLLAAVLWIQETLGSTRIADLGASSLDPATRTWILALVLPAALAKSAQMPFSSWLPRAMAAPTPASALLHSATMVKAGILLLLYLAPLLKESPLWSAALVPAGAVTCLWGAYRALTVHDLKRLLAFSTVSQLGLLVLTLGLGTDVALRPAALHLFAHAIFKAGLFLAVGSIERFAGSRDLRRLGGLRHPTPLLAILVAVLAGSMAGIPPLAGFLSKELILKKAMLEQAWTHGLAITAIVLGSVGTVAYSSRLWAGVFLGRPRGSSAGRSRLERAELWAPALLAGLTLAAGLAAPWTDRWFLEPVAASLVRGELPVKPLSLWYGLEVAFLLSGGIVGAGWLSHRRLGLRPLPWPSPPAGSPPPFDRLMAASTALGRRVEARIAGGRPRVYYGILLLLALAVVGQVLAPGFSGPFVLEPEEIFLLLALTATVLPLLAARERLTAVLSLSATGLVVALFFRRLAAPDLMLTQVAVEILATVLLAAALARLPPAPAGRDRGIAWRRLGGAAVGGLALATLCLQPPPGAETPLKASFLAAAPQQAAGDNVVNVILTDFRGLDTLVETLVVALAAFGAGGLLRACRRPSSLSGGAEGLLPRTAPLVRWIGGLLAVALLVKGHDQPGGGFVAGLVIAVILVLGFLSSPVGHGERELSRGLRLGILALLTPLLWPLAAGLAPLSHLHGELAPTGLKWHSALVFEIAITITIACAVASVAIRLWRSRA